METKICKKCGLEKNIDDFRKTYEWYRNTCKDCEKKYREEHREHKNEVNRLYYENNKDKKKEYYLKHFDDIKKKNQDRRAANPKKYQLMSRKYYDNNKDEILKRGKIYRENNSELIQKRRQKYYQSNKAIIHEKQRIRRNEDPVYKLKGQVRRCLNDSFKKKGFRKSKHTEEILGLPLLEFYTYLLKTYKENYGKDWDGKEIVHVDHIIPLATAKTEEEVLKLCHYTNLQLLNAEDNMDKKDKLDWSVSNNE